MSPTFPIQKEARVLWIGAHLDDEAFAYHTLRYLRDQGNEVHFLWASLPLERKKRLRRKREAERALASIGVQLSASCVLGYPERSLLAFVEALSTDITSCIQSQSIDVLVIPAFEGGHIDHDSTHLAVVSAVKRLGFDRGRVFEHTLYNGHNTGRFSPIHYNDFIPVDAQEYVLDVSPAEAVEARKYFQHYRDQQDIMLVARVFDAKKELFAQEKLRQLPEYDYSQRPTEDLLYEQYLPVRFEDVRWMIGALGLAGELGQLGLPENMLELLLRPKRNRYLSYWKGFWGQFN